MSVWSVKRRYTDSNFHKCSKLNVENSFTSNETKVVTLVSAYLLIKLKPDMNAKSNSYH